MPAQPPPARDSRRRLAGTPDDLSVTFCVPRAQEAGGHLVPNLLIAGATHAGAATLAADLGRHSDVCLPAVKRIDHFTPLRFGQEIGGVVEDYDNHFAGWSGQRYRLETSPVYFDGGCALVSSVAQILTDTRVLILLRDPAHRLWTSYTDKLARGRLPRAMTFEVFVDRCLALRANGADRFEGNRHFRTLSGGFYAEHLPGWLDTFGDRVKVVFTEHLLDDPVPRTSAIFQWLGLDPARAVPAPNPQRPGDPAATGSFGQAMNRRFWPVLQRTPGPWRPDETASPLGRMPRQSDRLRTRVRSLYAAANRELAEILRARGMLALPEWLREA
jgi:hypothetical protein